MTYFAFIFFSTIEFFSIIYFGLALFRQPTLKTKKYLRLLGLCLLLSLLSLAFKFVHVLESISPFIFMLIIVFTIRPITKIRFNMGILVGTIPYLLYGVVQTLIFVILDYLKVVSFDFKDFAFEGYIIQIIPTIIFFLLGVALKHVTGDGFIFNPDEDKGKIKYSNGLIASVVVISTLILSGIYYEAKSSYVSNYIYGFLIISIIIAGSIFYVSYQRDKEESAIDYKKYFNKAKEEVEK
jgi:hypothetical protein